MELLESHLDLASDEFKANAAHHRALAAELRERLARVKQGGGPELAKRHVARGKLFVRDRIEKALDPGTAFLDLSPLAAWELYDCDAPAAGIVTGVGTIHGPPLVKAATGEEVTAEELGGGDVHTRISGVADHLADDDAHALEMVRDIIAHLDGATVRRPLLDLREPRPPRHDPSEIYGILPR